MPHPATDDFKTPPPLSRAKRRYTMGKKKLGLSSFLFKPKPSFYPSWPWPACNNPKTDSFRHVDGGHALYKTVNSAYFDSAESCFTYSSEDHESFSTVSDDSAAARASLETVVRRQQSDRLFFDEPGAGSTSSILEQAKAGAAGAAGAGSEVVPFEDSMVLSLESEDPYRDFLRSMEEMVEAHGLREWEKLEELLLWYLRVNGKKTHGFIVGAFADLLVGISSPSPLDPSSSSSSNSVGIEEGSESS
ncbi:hypothetical protein Cni_G09095 [Canna indica]|uniref:Transcription repressor n=1 Tax=Canna indica TaxID=4628 RepID=A0AAQ3K1W4_9LILI|nr:hypothetical protein Cni_G09095 [Canna indica]